MASNRIGAVARSIDLQQSITRRKFLVICGGAAATLVIASCGDKDSEPEVEQVALSAADIPESGGEPLHSEDGRFYLINNDDNLLALYTKCTHQGCTVEWKPDQQSFACPCHGSKFDRNGIRTDGPAKRPLDLMSVRSQADGTYVVQTAEITERSQ